MVFSSMVFLWGFLPIIFIGYFIINDNYKNLLLLLGSLIFYAWGEPKYIWLMLCSILINYGIGLLMEKYEKQKKLLLILDVIINIGILGYFKYFCFLLQIVYSCMGTTVELTEIRLPIGISFFTFQILSYIIDLYRGHYRAQKNFVHLALYISFFPQLIAGPIVQYKDIDEQLNYRICTLEKTAWGIRKFVYGLGKKVIIANIIARCVDTIYNLDYTDLTGILAWIGAVLYTLQIYYDFSGYSDMAIGLGRIFGFDFQENFNYPYMSCSIQEFWQKWHISLGTWFKEYLYIPLGGNRRGGGRTYLNLVIVFFATGLWHGASFNFILWGLYHGLFQIIERLGLKKFLVKHRVIAHIYTFMIFTFGWVLFRSDNLIQAGVMVKRMLMPWEYTQSSILMRRVFGNKTVVVIFAGILGCGFIQIFMRKAKIFEKIKNSYLEVAYCSMIFIFCIAMLASSTYNPFIYFRF